MILWTSLYLFFLSSFLLSPVFVLDFGGVLRGDAGAREGLICFIHEHAILLFKSTLFFFWVITSLSFWRVEFEKRTATEEKGKEYYT